MEISLYRFLVYIVIAQLIIGILLGLIPFFLGRSRDRNSLANSGLLVTTIAGVISPLAAIFAVAVYVWLIVKKPAVSAGNQ